MDAEKHFERSMARAEISSEIYCPYCKELQEDDDGFYPVTYWGEDEVEMDCQVCNRTFAVKEYVERSYEVRTCTGELQSAEDFVGEELIQKKIEERKKRYAR